jgi:hypothetical protein
MRRREFLLGSGFAVFAALGEALAAELRRARLRDAGAAFGHDPRKRFVKFLDGNRQPAKVAYGAALFALDSEITPHAHKHMASAHLVLGGKAAAMISAVDNVHWFVARSHKAMTFDVIVDGLDPGEEDYAIQPVDILGGERRADGTIRAPLLSFEESSKRYTAAL